MEQQQSAIQNRIHQVREIKKKYERFLPAIFFVGGFSFDAVMLDRIDSPMALAQQALYLLLVLQILKFKTLQELNAWQPSPRLAKIWHYHSEALNFFLGTLLNFYTLFYFVSSSLATSAVFIIIVFGLLYVNEAPRFHERNLQIKYGLYAVAIFSFLFIMVTLTLQFVGYFPFLLAIAIGLFFFYGVYLSFIKRQLDPTHLKKLIYIPTGTVAAVLVALYVLRILPPIPLSVQYIGIFHDVKKVPGEKETKLLLSYDRPKWKFWQHGDQSFAAAPGDKVYCFARIFAPRNFKDKVVFHWLKESAAGNWQDVDRISDEIHGGRDEGFRTFVYKTNFDPGEWRVQIETSDGHEMGRIHFTVEKVEASATPREFRTLEQ